MQKSIKIPCELIERRITKKGKLESIVIDMNTKVNFLINPDRGINDEGAFETSLPLDLDRGDPMNIKYELKLKKPISNKKKGAKFPITIINYKKNEEKTTADFSLLNVWENTKNCMLDEIKIAIYMNGFGIQQLQKVDRSFYNHIYLSLNLLSWSYERLIKCLLNLIAIDNNGEIDPIPYPVNAREGHDLMILVKKLILLINDQKISSYFSFSKKEIEYLINDIALKIMIEALSEFGVGSRYYYLDIVLRGTTKYRNPSIFWDIIENKIHSLKGKESPPAGTSQLEAEMKQLTIETLSEFRKVLINFINLVSQKKFFDFDQFETSMPNYRDFNL